MLQNRDDLMSIVVLEAGASWPPWLSEYQSLAPNAVVVIAQASTEPSTAFESRVLHRIAEVASISGARVRAGVIVSGDAGGESRATMRQSIARALLAAMGRSEEAELVLAGGSEELDGSRHQMFALAGSLCEELGGTRVSVRVRFSSNQSGVMRTVASASAVEIDPIASKA